MSLRTNSSRDYPSDVLLTEAAPDTYGIDQIAAVRIRRDLSEIPGLYSKCEVMPADPSRLLRERVSGSRTADIPLDEDAMALRSDIVRVLTLWSELVVAERRWASPRGRDVRSLASYLGEQVDWLSGHPAASDFLEEIGHLAAAARAYLQVKDDSRRELGGCLQPGCGARVFAHLSGAGDSPPGIRCDAGHSWAVPQWLALASQFAAGAPETSR